MSKNKKIINEITPKVPKEYKKYIHASILSFFAILVIFSDPQTILWHYLYLWIWSLFWVYYKWIFSPVLILLAIFMFKDEWHHFNLLRFIGLIFYYFSITTFLWFIFNDYVGYFNFFNYLKNLFWLESTLFVCFILFVLSLIILFRFSPVRFTKKVVWNVPTISDIKSTFTNNLNEEKEEIKKETLFQLSRKEDKKEDKFDKKKDELTQMIEELKREKEELKKARETKQLEIRDIPKKIEIEKKVPEKLKDFFWTKESNKGEDFSSPQKINTSNNFTSWELPNINLLDNKWWNSEVDLNEVRQKELEIQEKLLQFKIEVTMEWFNVWPTVIQYRLKPNDWVKLQSIENLKKDLTLALHAKSIRIQAPIPWQWVVWIEVPNPQRQVVSLKEIISSKNFTNPKIKIPLCFWKNVNWEPVIWDLTKMPHMLVAGQTASWKSVWMNAFLLSMLYKFSPSDLKMILIDPKMVELSVYNWIPHLLSPVITNPAKAVNALKWCVAEMLRRYDLAKNINARNVEEYNEKVSAEQKLPYIVMVVDELADLMMSWDKKEVETSIARIAQMARAVWMHLIIATQRPSVDVITGLIKANIPSRVAFTVASQIDSRTVIDKAGAEDLLGMWDMLYFPTWSMEPERVQWVYVETHEVEAVVNQLKLTIDPDMLKNLQDDSITSWKSKLEWSILENYSWEQEEDPEIIEKAMEVVRESKKWSTSLIQRKLWLGYWRAAKILDILEDLWVVWPSNWSKPREVFID